MKAYAVNKVKLPSLYGDANVFLKVTLNESVCCKQSKAAISIIIYTVSQVCSLMA